MESLKKNFDELALEVRRLQQVEDDKLKGGFLVLKSIDTPDVGEDVNLFCWILNFKNCRDCQVGKDPKDDGGAK